MSSGNSSNSSSSWLAQGSPLFQSHSGGFFQSYSRGMDEMGSGQKAASFQDLIMGRCTLVDLMREFQMSRDTPNSLEDKIWGYHTQHSESFVGMGPSGAYLRQKSWPEPERTPQQSLPRLAADWSTTTPTDWTTTPNDWRNKSNADWQTNSNSDWQTNSNPDWQPNPTPEWQTAPTAEEFMSADHEFATSTPVDDGPSYTPDVGPGPGAAPLSSSQQRVLSSLPNAVLYALLNQLEAARAAPAPARHKKHSECRFCKNNGEREAYYRSHALKDGAGRVRCPVLRAFTCPRCGARGDAAHTGKYCPLSSADERIKSAAMMRSVRMASGRRRGVPAPSLTYVQFGDAPPSVLYDANVYNAYATAAPLDPSWAALEQKLSL